MASDLLMPKLGLTMTEGTLLEWKARPGEAVSKGQLLFVVETDKIASEIEADADGVLIEQLAAEGDTVAVGAVVGRIAAAGETAPPKPQINIAAAPAAPASPAAPAAVQTQAIAASADLAPANNADRVIATPLARRIAKANSVNIWQVAGSGPRGRIKAVDVERAMDARQTPQAASGSAKRMKPTPTQAAMARRLSAVKQGVPHFYLSTEIEVSALLALRETLNADPEAARLTLNHFVLKAVGQALAAHPNINRVWDDGELVAFAQTDVAMAVETDNGLLVPVVRDAGTRSLDAIAADARELVGKARSSSLGVSDMSGGAIAVSNAGMHDVTWVTSIINPGQSAILGVGSVRSLFRPDGQGKPSLRHEMGVVFSGDHRVHTGVEGLAFLTSIKNLLETPTRLLRGL